MRNIIVAWSVALTFALSVPVFAKAGPAIEGVWQTANGTHVRIETCAPGYCGKIVKVSLPDYIKQQFASEIDQVGGEQKVPDFFNKDPNLKSRPLMGAQILTITSVSGDRYSGRIYNAEDGKTYDGRLEIVDDNHARLSGCVLSVLCRSEDWTRVK